MADKDEVCMQRIAPRKLCGRPAKWAIALELVFLIDGEERKEGMGFFTCADHKYDVTATVQMRELDTE